MRKEDYIKEYALVYLDKLRNGPQGDAEAYLERTRRLIPSNWYKALEKRIGETNDA